MIRAILNEVLNYCRWWNHKFNEQIITIGHHRIQMSTAKIQNQTINHTILHFPSTYPLCIVKISSCPVQSIVFTFYKQPKSCAILLPEVDQGQ